MAKPNWDQQTEKEILQLQSEIEQSRYTINIIQQQLALLGDVKHSIQDALAVCNELMQNTKNDSVLIPIGGSIQLHCKILNVEEIYMDIGSGITKKIKLDEAVQLIQIRLEQLNDNIQRFGDQQLKISQNIDQMEKRLVEIAQTNPV